MSHGDRSKSETLFSVVQKEAATLRRALPHDKRISLSYHIGQLRNPDILREKRLNQRRLLCLSACLLNNNDSNVFATYEEGTHRVR